MDISLVTTGRNMEDVLYENKFLRIKNDKLMNKYHKLNSKLSKQDLRIKQLSFVNNEIKYSK